MLQSRCQGKVDGTVFGVILFNLTKNFILMNEISEKTWNEELNKPFLDCRGESLNLKDDNYWKPIDGKIKLSVREHTCVVNSR